MKPLCFVTLLCLGGLVPALAQPSDKQAKQQTIHYVHKLQTSDGSFLSKVPGPTERLAPTLQSTTTAVLALNNLGGDLPNKDAILKFVTNCYDQASGGFATRPGGKPDVANTAFGIMPAVELGLPVEPCQTGAIKYFAANVKSFEDVRFALASLERIKAPAPKKEEWLAEISKIQLPPRAAAKEPDARARELGIHTVALLRLEQQLKDVDGILKDLRAGQRDDGGFGKAGSVQGDLDSCYRTMRPIKMLGAQPTNVAGLRKFIQTCRNADHGYGVAPGEPSTVNATYFAAIVSKWLDEMK